MTIRDSCVVASGMCFGLGVTTSLGAGFSLLCMVFAAGIRDCLMAADAALT